MVKFKDFKIGHFYKPLVSKSTNLDHRSNCIYSFYNDSIVYMIGEIAMAVGDIDLWENSLYEEITNYEFEEIIPNGSKIIPIIFSPHVAIYSI